MNDNFNQNGSKNAQTPFLRVGAVISRFFFDVEPKEKFNCKCEKCNETRTVVFRVGSWGKKSYKCYPCLLKEGVQNGL
jgi:hypothetical protein